MKYNWISDQFRKFADNIDAGNTNATEEELLKLCELAGHIVAPDERLSKYEVAKLLKVSEKSVDYYVTKGYLPKGEKWKQGVVEKFWYKKDILKFMEEKQKWDDK